LFKKQVRSCGYRLLAGCTPAVGKGPGAIRGLAFLWDEFGVARLSPGSVALE
jgi:hypothetical protein